MRVLSVVRWSGRVAAGAVFGLGLVSAAAFAEESAVKRLSDFEVIASGTTQQFSCASGQQVFVFDTMTPQQLTEAHMRNLTEIDFACVEKIANRVRVVKRAVHAVPGQGFEIVKTEGLGIGTEAVVFKAL